MADIDFSQFEGAYKEPDKATEPQGLDFSQFEGTYSPEKKNDTSSLENGGENGGSYPTKITNKKILGFEEDLKEQEYEESAKIEREIMDRSEKSYVQDQHVYKEVKEPWYMKLSPNPMSGANVSNTGGTDRMKKVVDEDATNQKTLELAKVQANSIASDGKIAILWDGTVIKDDETPYDAERVYINRESDRTHNSFQSIMEGAVQQSIIANAMKRAAFAMYSSASYDVSTSDLNKETSAGWERKAQAYNQSTAEGLFATGLSFILDAPLFEAGGTAGKVSHQAVMQASRGLRAKLLKSGVSAAKSDMITTRGIKMFLQNSGAGIASSAGALATYDSVGELGRQLDSGVEFKDIDGVKVLNEGVKGAALGVAVGGISQVGAYMKGSKALRDSWVKKAATDVGTFGVENTAFLYGSAAMSGENIGDIDAADWIHGAMNLYVAGKYKSHIKAAGQILSGKKVTVNPNVYDERIAYKISKTILTKAERDINKTLGNDTFYDLVKKSSESKQSWEEFMSNESIPVTMKAKVVNAVSIGENVGIPNFYDIDGLERTTENGEVIFIGKKGNEKLFVVSEKDANTADKMEKEYHSIIRDNGLFRDINSLPARDQVAFNATLIKNNVDPEKFKLGFKKPSTKRTVEDQKQIEKVRDLLSEFKEEIRIKEEKELQEKERIETEIKAKEEELVDTNDLDSIIKAEEKAVRKENEKKKQEELDAKRQKRPVTPKVATSITKGSEHLGETVVDSYGNEGTIGIQKNGQLVFESKDGKISMEMGSASEAKDVIIEDYGVNLKLDLKAREIEPKLKEEKKGNDISNISHDELVKKSEKELAALEEHEAKFIKKYTEDQLKLAEKEIANTEIIEIEHKGTKYSVRTLKDGTYDIIQSHGAPKGEVVMAEVKKKYEAKKAEIENNAIDAAVKKIDKATKESEDRILKTLDWIVEATSLRRDRLYSNPLAIPQAMVNASFKIIRAAYKGSKNLANAINEGIKYLESRGQKVDRVTYMRYVKDNINKAPVEDVKEPKKVVEADPVKEPVKEKQPIPTSDIATRTTYRNQLDKEYEEVKFEDSDKYADKINKIKEHFKQRGIDISNKDAREVYSRSKQKTFEKAILELEALPKDEMVTRANEIIGEYINDNSDPKVQSLLETSEWKSVNKSATSAKKTIKSAKNKIGVIKYHLAQTKIREVKSEIEELAKARLVHKSSSKAQEKKAIISADEANTIAKFKEARKENSSYIQADIEILLDNVENGKMTERQESEYKGLMLALKEKLIDELEVQKPKKSGEHSLSADEINEQYIAYDEVYQELANIRGDGRSKILEKELALKKKHLENAEIAKNIAIEGKVRGGAEKINEFRSILYADGVNAAIDYLSNEMPVNLRGRIKKLEALRRMKDTTLSDKKKIQKKVESIVSRRALNEQEAQDSMKEQRDKNSMIKNGGLLFESFEGLIEFVSRGKAYETKTLVDMTAGTVRKARRAEEDLKDYFYTKLQVAHKEMSEGIGKMYNDYWEASEKYGITLYHNPKSEGGNPSVYTEKDKMSLDEILKRYVELKNPRIKEMYETNNNLTPESVKELEAHVNKIVNDNPALKKYAEWQVNEFYPELYKIVNKTYREMNGMDMPIENLYSPLSIIGGDKNLELNRSTSNSFSNIHSSVSHGNALRRVQHGRAIDLNSGLDKSLAKYMEDMLFYAAFAPTVRDVNAIISNKEFKRAVVDNSGISAYNMLKKHLDDISNNGLRIKEEASKRLYALKNNAIVATLMLNPKIIATQLGSMPAYAVETNTAMFIAETAKIIKFFGEESYTRDMIKLANSPFMKARYRKGFTRDMAHALTSTAKHISEGKGSLKDRQMWFVKQGDRGAILLGGTALYRIKKREAIKRLSKEAIDLFESKGMSKSEVKDALIDEMKIINETAERDAYEIFASVSEKQQQSSNVENLSAAQRDIAFNLMTSYASSPIQYAQQQRKALRNIKRGRADMNDIKRLIMFTFTMPFMYNLAQTLTSGDDEDEEKRRSGREIENNAWMSDANKYQKAAAKSLAEGMLQGGMFDMLGGRDIVGAMASGEKPFSATSARSLSAIGRALDSSVKLRDVVMKDNATKAEKVDAAASAIAQLLSIRYGMGFNNAYKLAKPVVIDAVGGYVEGEAVDYIFGGTKVKPEEKRGR